MPDLKSIEQLVAAYITKNFDESAEPKKYKMHGFLKNEELDEVDFLKLYAQAKTGGETFSEMLLRLIKESGEKNSAIYNRAQVDRQLFSRIKKNKNYKPRKDTAIAFALALKLDFERAKELLAVAGYVLTRSKRDLIIKFFIEQEIFDTVLLNDYLHEYKQTILFGR